MNAIPCASPKPPAEVLRGKTGGGFCAAERRLPRRTHGKRRVKAARGNCQDEGRVPRRLYGTLSAVGSEGQRPATIPAWGNAPGSEGKEPRAESPIHARMCRRWDGLSALCFFNVGDPGRCPGLVCCRAFGPQHRAFSKCMTGPNPAADRRPARAHQRRRRFLPPFRGRRRTGRWKSGVDVHRRWSRKTPQLAVGAWPRQVFIAGEEDAAQRQSAVDQRRVVEFRGAVFLRGEHLHAAPPKPAGDRRGDVDIHVERKAHRAARIARSRT